MDRALGRLADRLWNPYGGLLLTLVGVATTELAAHVLALPSIVGVSALLITLAAVAYSALKGGLPWGAASAALLALYTLHYVSPHGTLMSPEGRVVQGGATMLVIGFGIALPMALIRRREDRLRRALEARNADLEARNRELSDANAALEAFGYVVSHDLKEPVRAIENYLEAADEEYGTEQGRQYLRTARNANQRLTRMLQGLLAYSRASATMPDLHPLDPAEVLRGEACRAQYEEALHERRGTLEVAPDLPRVLGDDVILSQLLGNLVLNAVRHNPRDRPLVRVRAEDAPEGRARLVVEDDGPGFPPDVLQRVRGLSGTRPATVKGGFGLVISHLAAQRMGGRLTLGNGPQGGALACVELAAASADAAGAKVQIPARA